MSLFGPDLAPVNGERIRQARELRALTQTALADAIGVDQTMIAHLERGAKQPNRELLEAISSTLQMPTQFFRNASAPRLPQGTLLFRAKAGLGKRTVARAHAQAELVFEMGYRLSQFTERIPVTVPKEGEPKEAARTVRSLMGVECDAPLPGLVRKIERLGVLVVALPDLDDCDAFAVWAGTDRELPVMGLAVGRPADRTRMNAAHELGHLVLHGTYDGGTPKLEREAYQFAAELLMPENVFHRMLHAERVNLFSLAQLKSTWGVSMQSLARRAKDLEIITERQFRYLMQQISARGWRMKEPEFSPLAKELPRGIRKMAEVAFGADVTPEVVAKKCDFSPEFVRDVFSSYASAPVNAVKRKARGAVVIDFPK